MVTTSEGRRGTGLLLWIVLGVVIVLVITLVAQHMLSSSTRQEAAAAFLGARAVAVLGSCLDETTYRVFGEANGLCQTGASASASGRLTVPAGATGPRWNDFGVCLRTQPPKGSTAASPRFSYDAWLTRRAYEGADDVQIGTATYGVVEQRPFPNTNDLKTNENRGIIEVEAQVTVTLPGARLKLTKAGRNELEYKTVLLGVPYPFNRYTFFDRAEAPSATTTVASPASSASTSTSSPATSDASCAAIKDRFFSYLCQYDRLRAKGRGGLDPFPVLAMDPRAPKDTTDQPAAPSGSGLVPAGPKDEPVDGPAPVYSVLARVGDAQYGYRGYTIPAFWGENLLGGSPEEEMSDQILLMARQMFRKAGKRESAELARYYPLLEEDSWRERRTHTFPDLASFVQSESATGVLDLAGIYWIDGPVTIDHAYRGHGVVVTTDPAGIRVRKAQRDPAADGHLTLVALAGDVVALGDPQEVHANLVAVHGTIRGFGKSKVYGTVYVSYLPSDREEGPEIQKPIDGDWKPVSDPSERPAPGLARRLRAFIVPRPVRRDGDTSRRRA